MKQSANPKLFILLIFISAAIGCKQDTNTITSAPEVVEQSNSNDKPPFSDHETNDTNEETSLSEVIDTLDIDADSIKSTKNQDTTNQISSTESHLKKKKIQRPKIKFETLFWDFGELIEGDIVSKKFKFTNTGNGPLQILATGASCGCTTPSFPFLDIAPGDSNVIGVTYNSVGKLGLQNPEVTVESNTHPRKTTIKLRAFVRPNESPTTTSSKVSDTLKTGNR